MSSFDQNFPRRVHLKHRNGGLFVRIERQNTKGSYFWGMCLSTVMFVMFEKMIVDAAVLHRNDALYILPIALLGVVLYLLALAYFIWGAFGIEEVSVEGGTLRWTLTALRWSRTRLVQLEDVTSIRAITPWHGLDNTVEVITSRKRQVLGDRLRRDETIELAHKLSHAIGCEIRNETSE